MITLDLGYVTLGCCWMWLIKYFWDFWDFIGFGDEIYLSAPEEERLDLSNHKQKMCCMINVKHKISFNNKYHKHMKA